MRKCLPITIVLALGHGLHNAQGQTTLSGDHTVNGNFTVGDPAGASKVLRVTGQSEFKQRVYFSQANLDGWNLENTGGDFVFFPAADYQYRQIRFRNSGDAVFPKTVSIGNVGNAGIGTLALAVGGSIGARNIYVRAPAVAWPDYVFQPTYRLRPLAEVAQFVQANGHLPDMPSAAAVQVDGLDLGSMNALLLRKVEELTLYVMALKKENEELQARVQRLEN